MKKNITKLLLLTSILSIGSILNAHNKDVSNDIKKPPINIRIDENGQVMKDQTGNNNSSEIITISLEEVAHKQLKIQQVQ